MRVLVTGANGGLGKRLFQELKQNGFEAHGTDIDTLDITDYQAVLRYMTTLQPQLVFHCAALTHVDRCALEPELAYRINGYGTGNIANACVQTHAAICYISTNEVFDGQRGTPYFEYDAPHPINPYGFSKWVGEQAIRDTLPAHYIVRVAWLFTHGGANFTQKILERAASGQALSVVINEIGNPTYVEDLIKALIQLVQQKRYGIYHLTNEGYTSRYDFARYLLDCAGYQDTPIKKVIGAQYQRPSRPPVYSALFNIAGSALGVRLRSWQEAVAAFVETENAPRTTPPPSATP